ncbi:MAG: serine hydrolase [Deltaproteobacteria bacterium]|nr:serine hydrolase [Deltaproteobacteria bacterium]
MRITQRSGGIAATIAVVFSSGCAARNGVRYEKGSLAESSSYRATVDARASQLLNGQWVTGLAVGLVTPSGVETFGYGRVDAATSRVPDANTVFEIGSITKVFTGLLLAEANRRGLVALNAPLGQCLPSATIPANAAVARITMAQLATHTSGLPRLPANLRPRDPANPYADYSVSDLYRYLGSHVLAREPGATYEYSNLGGGLLGHALEVCGKSDYVTLVKDWITSPLGMTSTSIALTDEMRSRLARGHDADGSPVANWDLTTLAGAGGLRSTVSDLVHFLQANINPSKEPISQAISTTQKARRDRPGGKIGLGWHIGFRSPTDAEIRWHNGGTGGYHSFIAFDPSAKVGVVVLANSSAPIVDKLGVSLINMLRRQPHSFAIPPSVRIDPQILDRYVGRYQLVPTFVITVTREGARLFAQATGQSKFRVFAKNKRRFSYRVVDAEIEFETGANGPASILILHQGGQSQRASRLP